MSASATIDRVRAYAPVREVSIDSLADRLRLNRFQVRLFQRVHGLEWIRTDPEGTLLDLIAQPAAEVLDGIDLASVRYVIYAHTIQEVTPSDMDAAEMVRQRLHLHRATAFAVTQQNCASGLAAIDIASELLRFDSDRSAVALVVTGEKPFSHLAQLIENTTVMGEGAGACLVRLDGGGDRILSYVSRTLGQYAAGVRLGPAALQDFGTRYAGTLAAVIREALDNAGLELCDLDRIIPHNVNRSSWLAACRELGINIDTVYLDNVRRYGHCFCADFFLNYSSMRENGKLLEGGRYLIAAVGLGATFAAMIIQHGTGVTP